MELNVTPIVYNYPNKSFHIFHVAILQKIECDNMCCNASACNKPIIVAAIKRMRFYDKSIMIRASKKL